MKNPRFILWFDLETGGLDPHRHQITQIAAIPTLADFPNFTPIDGDPTFEAKVRIQPERVTEQALEVQGYTEERWEAAHGIRSVFRMFSDFANLYSNPSISKAGNSYRAAEGGGHNIAGFDLKFLEATAKRLGVWCPVVTFRGMGFDTIQLANWVSVIRDRPHKMNSLVGLSEDYGLPEFGAHDALEDVRATIRLARALSHFMVVGCSTMKPGVAFGLNELINEKETT